MPLALRCVLLPVTPLQQNCSLLWNPESGHGALIDPGGEPERLLAAAREHGVTIDKLLLTHGHLDHAGAVADLVEQLAVPVEGPHEDDRFWLEQLPEAARRYGFPPVRSFEPTRWLSDGDCIEVAGCELQVLHCPGHTPGHVVFHHADAKLAWVGDVLFQGSVGRSDFPRGNHEQLIASIHDQLLPLGDEVRFVPGHGPVSSFGHERRTNPYLRMAGR